MVSFKKMSDIGNWTEVTKGLYKYVIGANCCYEIHIWKRNFDDEIKDAMASLYVVGDWQTSTGECFFEREILASGISIADCLEVAIDDYKENMND